MGSEEMEEGEASMARLPYQLTERDVQRMRAQRKELVERIGRTISMDGHAQPLPGLHLYRHSVPWEQAQGMVEPSVCVVAQGSKELLLGQSRYRYDRMRYLLSTVALPSVEAVIEASKARPCLSLRLELTPALVTSVMVEAGHSLQPPGPADARALAVSPLESDLLDATVRLVRLLDAPENEQQVLLPLIAQEIVYRLLIGEQGGLLRHLSLVDGHTSRISRVIERLRQDIDQPLRIPRLARELGGSVSGLHHHFKAVTALSPLQYQKRLRLLEARRLMLGEHLDAASAAVRVGYQNAAHFNREYKRFFGVPPMRDVRRLREEALDSRATTGIPVIQEPWRPDELRERVARGEAQKCRDCPDFEGLPVLNGRCPRCDENEFRLDMPPFTNEIVDAAIGTALGDRNIDAEAIPRSAPRARDASTFDNRASRGWQGFRIQVVTVSRRDLPWPALPLLWVLKLERLADDVEGTRLQLVSEDDEGDDTEQGVVLALLWRKGEPGYLRGQWVGQLRRYQWDMCDAAQFAHLPQEQRELWWSALREARKRGPKSDSRKIFESYEAFEQACRDLLTADGWGAAFLSTPRTAKEAMWKAIVRGKVAQATLAEALNVSVSALRRALKEYERSDGLTWRDRRRRIADWAQASGGDASANY